MNTLVEYRVLDRLKVINEGTSDKKKLKVRGRFQKCDEQNNNGRIYPRPILEAQVAAIQEKINERSLVGALDHPPNDGILLSQASHLITKLYVEPNGDVMGEAEILSTPSGKIVEALLSDGVKIGISSRGLGTLSETKTGKVVNEDYKLLTFDLVSDPSTKGAYPELTEAVKLNSQKAQKIVSKMKNERILLTALTQKINEKLSESKKNSDDGYDAARDRKATSGYTPYKKANGKPDTSKPEKNPNSTSTLQKNLVKELDKANKPKGKKFKFAENAIIKQLTSLMKCKLKETEFPPLRKMPPGFVTPVKTAASTGKRDPANKKKKAKFNPEKQGDKFDRKSNDAEMDFSKSESTITDAIKRIEEGSATSKDKAAVKNFLITRLNDIYEPWEPSDKPANPSTEASRAKDKIQWIKRLISIIDEI